MAEDACDDLAFEKLFQAVQPAKNLGLRWVSRRTSSNATSF
jgi:hypothetical protein